jgi:TonB family protein
MNDAPASPAAFSPAAEPQLPGPTPPREGWTRKKFFLVLGFVFAFHVALIILFGTKKQIAPRAVANVPNFQLAKESSELIALDDPTLFARPNARDVVSAYWRRMDPPGQPNFNWSENPRYLPPAPENIGAVSRDLAQKNRPAGFTLNFKPDPKPLAPAETSVDSLPQDTTLAISSELAQRRLLNATALQLTPINGAATVSYTAPSLVLALNDVIDPCQVQVWVDAAGNVASPVVLKSSGNNDADQRSLQLVRNLQFAPATDLTFGEITFVWHTVPTNAAPASSP